MQGQMSLFEYVPPDHTFNRQENEYKVPSWMYYERCENCQRWARYPINEQPPCGWGVYGFCNEHKQRTEKCGYCIMFDNKNKL